MPTKSKRLVIKAVKKWCRENDYEFVRYEDGSHKHDKVHVRVWGINVSVTVACTPSNGAQSAAKRCVNTLNTKVVRLRQKIVEGRYRR